MKIIVNLRVLVKCSSRKITITTPWKVNRKFKMRWDVNSKKLKKGISWSEGGLDAEQKKTFQGGGGV